MNKVLLTNFNKRTKSWFGLAIFVVIK